MLFFLSSLHLLIIYQVVLESFPVSSSGHIVIVEKLFKLAGFSFEISGLSESFDYLLHGPPILILLIFFRKEWFNLFYYLISRFKFSFESWSCSYKKLWKLFVELAGFVLVADIISGLIYLLIVKFGLRGSEFIYADQMLLIGFVITMLSLFSLVFIGPNWAGTLRQAHGEQEISSHYERNKITLFKIIILGIVQGIAALPGISRFGTTFVTARWLGFSSRRAFQFSFLMHLPLIIFVFSVSIFKMFTQPRLFFYFDYKFFIVLIVAAIVAYFGLHFSYALAKARKFWLFGFYLFIPICLTIGFLR